MPGGQYGFGTKTGQLIASARRKSTAASALRNDQK
jgi:hypothetical protein